MPSLYGDVIIPEAVADELRQLSADVVNEHNWLIVLRPRAIEQIQQLMVDLDRGESEAIALAEELKADCLLIDERKGRHYAQLLRLTFIGTLGVLLNAKKAGLISAIGPIITDLQETAGAWYHPALVSEVLQLANEV